MQAGDRVSIKYEVLRMNPALSVLTKTLTVARVEEEVAWIVNVERPFRLDALEPETVSASPLEQTEPIVISVNDRSTYLERQPDERGK